MIDFKYQAANVPFFTEFEIKNIGEDRVDFRFSCNNHFQIKPLDGEIELNETLKITIIGRLLDCRSYTGRIKIYYGEYQKALPELIPLKVKIMKDYYLSTYKLTVD